MCEIPDNYICIDNIMEELDDYQESLLAIHFDILAMYRNIAVIQGICIDKHRLQEPLRELEPINKKLENTIQKILSQKLGEQK